MEKETLEIKHQSLLQPLLKEMGVALSEYSFASLYLFRAEHSYEVVFSKKTYIKGKTRDGFTYLMPTTKIEKIDWDDLKAALKEVDFLFPIPEEWQPYFPESEFQITHKDQDSDYIYLSEKMSTYAGRALSGRRNLVKQFKENFPQFQNFFLDESKVKDGLQVLEAWQTHAKGTETFTNHSACKIALENFTALDLTGFITYVRDKPVGIIIGESITEEMYVIHFTKGLIEYKGIYQFLYQEFAKVIKYKYVTINMEQDLGLPDLQHAKTAYNPDHLSRKLRVSYLPINNKTPAANARIP